jgi:uncharacterized protein
MSQANAAETDFVWLINSFVSKVPGVANTILVSSDGLALAKSQGFPDDRADQLAAVVSGLTSLTIGASRCFSAGDVRQILVEMDEGYLFIMSVSEGSSIAALADPSSDIGLVGYEMSLLVSRVGSALTPALRAQLSAASL